MKITIDIKENEKGTVDVTLNKLTRKKTTKDTEFNCAINVVNAIARALKDLEKEGNK